MEARAGSPSFREVTSTQRPKFSMHLRSPVVGDLCTMANMDDSGALPQEKATQISANDISDKFYILVRVNL